MNKRTQKAKSDITELADGLTFVTVSRVAKVIGFSERTIRRMMESGQLPARKFGSEWRMHRDDFEKLTSPQLAESAA